MKRVIFGKNYKFVIRRFRNKNNYCFFIEAIDLHRQTHSYINNLNTILSEFNIGIDDKEVPESQWAFKRKKSKHFFLKAVDFLSDIDFRVFVEKQLNLDQQLGEWNKLCE